MKSIAFFDLETSSKDHRILDIGCVRTDGNAFHQNSLPQFFDFVRDADFLCGHNVFQHDLRCIHQAIGNTRFGTGNTIDTLYLSPLLFPRNPYHHLLKDDKLQTEELNNPLNDSIKARELFYDELTAFQALTADLQKIYLSLLQAEREFASFFRYTGYSETLSHEALEQTIYRFFEGRICEHAPLGRLFLEASVSLAYALALVNVTDKYSITPPWVLHRFPDVERVLFLLRNKPCVTGCRYCNEALDPIKALKRHFGYERFRSYGGEDLQEKAVRAAYSKQIAAGRFSDRGWQVDHFPGAGVDECRKCQSTDRDHFAAAVADEGPGG